MATFLNMKTALILVTALLDVTSAVQTSVIQCDNDRPQDLALPDGYQSLDSYRDWTALCNVIGGMRPNAGCLCIPDSGSLECIEQADPVRSACFNHCHCKTINYEPPASDDDSDSSDDSSDIMDGSTDSGESVGSTDTNGKCDATCTSVLRGCPIGDGSCSCTAPALSIYFWFGGICKSTIPLGGIIGRKRSVTPTLMERSASNSTHASNVTSSISPYFNNATIAAMSQGNFPAPCNASYVSLACANSTDGIVHEGPEKWLGALLPANATELPPIPAGWLKTNGLPANHSDHNRWL